MLEMLLIWDQWFIRAVQGDLWRRNGHAEFVDEDEEGEHGSEKELVEVVAKATPSPSLVSSNRTVAQQ